MEDNILTLCQVEEERVWLCEDHKKEQQPGEPRNSSSQWLGPNTFCMGGKKAFQGFIRSVFNTHYWVFFDNKIMIKFGPS